MSDQKHGEDELFTSKATDATDSREDSASTTDNAERKATKSTEESNQDLDTAEKKQLEIKEGALKKIMLGEKTLDDYDSQPWLKKVLAEELEAEKKATIALDDVKTREMARKIAQEELARERERNEFEYLKGQLNAAETTKAQRATIEAEFTRLKGKLGAKDALQTAIRLASVDLEGISMARRATSVPVLGDKVAEDDATQKVMNLQSLPQSEINKLARSKSRMYRSG